MSCAVRIDGRQDSDDPAAAENRVHTLADGDSRRWDRFVSEHPQGTFYHLSGWRRVFEDSLGHPTFYLYGERNGEISAVLPLAQVKSWLFGNALISLPFLVYGGPLSIADDARQALLNRARDLARELRADYLELRNRTPLAGDWPTRSAYATFRKELFPDPEQNLAAVPRKQRAMIRKGMKAGLQPEVDTDTDRLYRAMLECKRNLGTPFFGPGYLRSIKEVFGDQAEVLTVTHNGETICSVMSFRFRDEILPYYGGGGSRARSLYGNDFMYWAVMEKACREGVRIFDYGRSMEGSGAYRFKKHWGFEPEPLHYQFSLSSSDASLPNLSPANPKYKLLIRLWQRLPLAAAGLLGPPIARRLG